jgi:hypothetical protein
MYSTLLMISLFINLRPFKAKGMNLLVVINLTTLLYLTYLQLLFTDYVDQSISDSTGNQFLYTTICISAFNLFYAAFDGIK